MMHPSSAIMMSSTAQPPPLPSGGAPSTGDSVVSVSLLSEPSRDHHLSWYIPLDTRILLQPYNEIYAIVISSNRLAT